MADPFFTIAIPTKNRPEQLGDAIRSVLDQTFPDLEVVVCDNSDAEEAPRSAERVRAFDDPRIRYVRTSGQLSMPDNWERAVAEARGEYVGVLTDRSVFRPDALSVIHAEISATGAGCVSWFNDLYGRDDSGTAFKRRDCTMRRHRLESEKVIHYLFNGHQKYATKIVPKLMTGVCRRSVLETIRASAAGRCCPPVAPDYCSGFLILAHVDWVLMLDEAMYVSCGLGTGSAFRRRSELGDRFRRDLGMTWEDMVDRMPTPAAFSHALILNDFMRIRDALPDRLGAVELNRAQYYAGCLNDYAKVAARGITDRNEDLDVLLAALERESDEVRRDVEAMPVYRRAVQYRTQGRLDLKTKVATKVQTMSSDPPPSFDTVFAAMARDAANPRTPVAESFLDVLPMIDTETVPARKHRPQGRAERPDPGPGPKGTSRPAAPRPLNALRARLRLRSRIARLTRGA